MAKIVKIYGGLANQMFQYAFGVAVGARQFDLSWFDQIKKMKNVTKRDYELGVFNVQVKVYNQKIGKLVKKIGIKTKEIQEKQYCHYDPSLLHQRGRVIFDGYFQNEKYMNPVRKQLIHDFTLRDDLDSENMEMLNKIKNCESVFIHVRHGDYIKYQNTFPILDMDYYNSAMKEIEKLVKNPHYFVFSDDINWGKENIKTNHNITFVDLNNPGHIDMELMKNCKHCIIANSSFSWMSAYLNQNANKIVIAPKKWIIMDGKHQENIGLSDKYIKV